MDENIDHQSTQPVPRANQIRPIPITYSPKKLILATLVITIPRRNANHNQVELNAQVGVQGIKSTTQVLFKIYRNGDEIFSTQQRIPAGQTQKVTLRTVEQNVEEGRHLYKITAEITNNSSAAIVGPVLFNATAAVKSDNRHRDTRRNQDGDRNHGTNLEQDQNTKNPVNQQTYREVLDNPNTNKGKDTIPKSNQNKDHGSGRRSNRDKDRNKDRSTDQKRDRNRDRSADQKRDRNKDRSKNRRRDAFSEPIEKIDKEIQKFIDSLDNLL